MLFVSLTLISCYSYGTYLTAAGNAPVSVRSIDWLRDHGFATAVTSAEQWWYTRNVPTGTHAAKSDLPSRSYAAILAAVPSDTIPSIQPTAQAGEGVWQGVDGLAIQSSVVQQTFVRPDASYPSVAVNLVRFDQSAITTTYVPGLREPGGAGWAWNSQIPPAQRPSLVAAFNAGFKFKDTAGGAYTEGRPVVRPLQNGLASIVIRSNGKVEIDKWGRDATLSNDVASVRQNLELIIDHGIMDPGLISDRNLRWGSAKSQLQYTWRSGIGVDVSGRLIYAAGPKASLTDLASALKGAGAVRAMQLDIHDQVVTFNWFRTTSGITTGTKLTPSMQRKANRFLASDQRDFLVIESR